MEPVQSFHMPTSMTEEEKFKYQQDVAKRFNGEYEPSVTIKSDTGVTKIGNTIDNGTRHEYESGFVRESNEGKLRVDLIPRGIMRRVAQRFTDGAVKYGARNYAKADKNNPEEMDRFKAAALRHLLDWMDGVDDEDHAAACVANIAMYEEIVNG